MTPTKQSNTTISKALEEFDKKLNVILGDFEREFDRCNGNYKYNRKPIVARINKLLQSKLEEAVKANDKKWKTKLKTIESEVVKESQDYQTDEEGKKHYYVSVDLFKQKLQLLHDQTN